MSLTELEEYIESGNAGAIDNLLHTNPALCQQKTSHEISPLLLACYYNKHQIVKIILQHIQEITIWEAAAAGLTEAVSELLLESPELLNTFSEHGFTPLGMATHFGNTEIVRHLLLKGADVNLPSQNGYHVYPLHAAISAGFDEIAKLLVEASADVNVLQSSRTTPLHAAAQNGNIEMLILLLENGALVDIKNDFGKTAADLAAEKGYMEISKILS